MDNEEKIQKTESWPVSFRVICVGKEMSAVFRTIISFGFEGVSVQTTTMFPNPTPTDEDKMVILLANGYSQQLENIAKSFYQAGVLTLIISTHDMENLQGVCDAMTVSNWESMPLIVKSLIDPLIKQGIICFDVNDLSMTLHNAQKFKIVGTLSRTNENRIDVLVKNLDGLLEGYNLSEPENITIILYHNKKVNPPLAMNELPPLSEFIGNFPEDVSVIWGLSFDNEMPTDEIRLDAIIACKNLKLCHLHLPMRTGASIGMKSSTRRNFEVGMFTDDTALV